MKKLVAVLLSIVIILTFVACNKENTSNVDVLQENGEKIATEITEPVTIEFWHAMSGANGEALEKIVKDFNEEYKNVTVNLIYQGNYKELFEKLTGAAKANQLPTLTQIYPNRLSGYIMNDLVEDLTPYIFSEEVGFSKTEFEDIPQVFREGGIWDDKYYAFPFNKSTYLLFYNKLLLEEQGVKPPTTWEELREAAEKLTIDKDGDGKADVVGLGLQNSVGIDFSFWMEQAGGHLINEISNTEYELLFNSDAGVEAFDFVSGMVKDGVARLAGEDKNITGPFARGEMAMGISSTSGIPYIEEASTGNIEWDAVVLPKHKKEAALFAGTDVAIYNTSTAMEKLAAWEFIKFFVNKENTTYWATNTGYLPVRYSAINDAKYQQFIKEYPVKGEGLKQLEIGFRDPKILNGYAIHSNMQQALEEVIAGEKTSKEALEEAMKKTKEDIDQALQNFGLN